MNAPNATTLLATLFLIAPTITAADEPPPAAATSQTAATPAYWVVAEISLTNPTGRTALFQLQSSDQRWRAVGTSVNADGLVTKVEIVEGWMVLGLLPDTSNVPEFKSVAIGESQFLQAQVAGLESTTVLVDLHRCALPSCGPPRAFEDAPDKVKSLLGKLPETVGLLLNAWNDSVARCEKLAYEACGPDNTCHLKVTLGPDGLSQSVTCCGPHAVSGEQSSEAPGRQDDQQPPER
jgi:hypothetical protein